MILTGRMQWTYKIVSYVSNVVGMSENHGTVLDKVSRGSRVQTEVSQVQDCPSDFVA